MNSARSRRARREGTAAAPHPLWRLPVAALTGAGFGLLLLCGVARTRGSWVWLDWDAVRSHCLLVAAVAAGGVWPVTQRWRRPWQIALAFGGMVCALGLISLLWHGLLARLTTTLVGLAIHGALLGLAVGYVLQWCGLLPPRPQSPDAARRLRLPRLGAEVDAALDNLATRSSTV